MRTKYTSENIGFGYGHAKTMLFDVLNRYISPYRDARTKLLENPSLVEEKLAK
jgi:tryptophanyl-tRNA synthetase